MPENGKTEEIIPRDILKEVTDPKSPLMEKFRSVAPGTYNHAKNVASLCEAVAVELDLDVELLKTAGVLHDIGKTVNPNYFIENQNGKPNPHDGLDPEISYQIITRHVGDTVLMLLQISDLPRKLLEIVSQHHGNTILKYFYQKSGSDIDDIYRYKSTPPQSIEACILMLADQVEATARALASKGELETSEDRKSVINSTVRNLMDDDQLDDIKVGELKLIRKVLYKEIESMYHRREPYGNEKENSDEDLTPKD